MEPSGRNQWQSVANRLGAKTARTSEIRCRWIAAGCRDPQNGKEGVDGSSPSEGFGFPPAQLMVVLFRARGGHGLRRPRSVHRRPPWPLSSAQFVEQADRMFASVACEVAVVAVDHGQACAHVAGQIEGGDACTEREGREGVSKIVDPAHRLDPGGTLCGLPLAVAEVVQVEVAAPLHLARAGDAHPRRRRNSSSLRQLQHCRHARRLARRAVGACRLLTAVAAHLPARSDGGSARCENTLARGRAGRGARGGATTSAPPLARDRAATVGSLCARQLQRRLRPADLHRLPVRAQVRRIRADARAPLLRRSGSCRRSPSRQRFDLPLASGCCERWSSPICPRTCSLPPLPSPPTSPRRSRSCSRASCSRKRTYPRGRRMSWLSSSRASAPLPPPTPTPPA